MKKIFTTIPTKYIRPISTVVCNISITSKKRVSSSSTLSSRYLYSKLYHPPCSNHFNNLDTRRNITTNVNGNNVCTNSNDHVTNNSRFDISYVDDRYAPSNYHDSGYSHQKYIVSNSSSPPPPAVVYPNFLTKKEGEAIFNNVKEKMKRYVIIFVYMIMFLVRG